MWTHPCPRGTPNSALCFLLKQPVGPSVLHSRETLMQNGSFQTCGFLLSALPKPLLSRNRRPRRDFRTQGHPHRGGRGQPGGGTGHTAAMFPQPTAPSLTPRDILPAAGPEAMGSQDLPARGVLSQEARFCGPWRGRTTAGHIPTPGVRCPQGRPRPEEDGPTPYPRSQEWPVGACRGPVPGPEGGGSLSRNSHTSTDPSPAPRTQAGPSPASRSLRHASQPGALPWQRGGGGPWERAQSLLPDGLQGCPSLVQAGGDQSLGSERPLLGPSVTAW